jgi:hypothetical protein
MILLGSIIAQFRRKAARTVHKMGLATQKAEEKTGRLLSSRWIMSVAYPKPFSFVMLDATNWHGSAMANRKNNVGTAPTAASYQVNRL